jgi:hypothetical protein
MMTEENDNADGELVATVTADPIRAAFAAAMGAVVQVIPPGYAQEVAIEQLIAAHMRTEELLARRRVLN